MNSLKLYFLLTAFLAFSVSIIAQPHSGQPQNHKPHFSKEHKEAIKAYKQEYIKPVMSAQRQKLDNKISASDKKEIDALREKAQVFRAEMKTAREEAKANRQLGEKPDGKHREALKSISDTYKADFDEAKVIALKYDAEITALLDEISEEREKWKADIQSINYKYRSENRPESLDKEQPGLRKKSEGKDGQKRGRFFDNRHERQKVRFLLLKS